MLPAARKGRFLVLDGVDGCGKTTQAARLVKVLACEGLPEPLHVREPGSTPLGERLRAALLDRELTMDAGVETLLFAAARRQMLREQVEPALAAGRDVVCERFHPSTFAYQAVAGGLGEDEVTELLQQWAGAPRPDLVLVLELDPGEAGERRGGDSDRIEDKGLEFQRAVARGFRRYVEREEGVIAVDARGSRDQVEARIQTALGLHFILAGRQV